MNLKRFSAPKIGDDVGDAPVGGTAFVSLNSDFVSGAFKKLKGDLDGHRHGLKVGQQSPPGSAVLENPAQPFVALIESNYDGQVGLANSVMAHALAEADLEGGDLNEAAVKATTENRVASHLYAAQEQAKPVIARRNDARNNLTGYEHCEGQDRLSEGAYDPWGTVFKQFVVLFLVMVPDAFLNAFTFASSMRQGLLQALATSFFSSAAMAACGVMFGTGLRYFNYRRYPARRMMWRCATVVAAVAALAIAVLLAQYRALLEVAASDAPDAASYSVFTTPPSIVGLPVFIGSMIVFAWAVSKFRGGPGTPWAHHADHAAFDRAYHNAESEVAFLKEDFAQNAEQIRVDTINFLHDANKDERERLKAAKATCAKAKLKIVDLKNSHLKFVRAAEPDIAASLNALLAARPDLDADDLPTVQLRGMEGFPDPQELDAAISRAEAAFARRTEQLADLEKFAGGLATKAREDFSRFLAKAIREDEKRRNPVSTVTIRMNGGPQ